MPKNDIPFVVAFVIMYTERRERGYIFIAKNWSCFILKLVTSNTCSFSYSRDLPICLNVCHCINV